LTLNFLHPGGLLLPYNIFWGGNVPDETINDADTRALREISVRIHADEWISRSLLPLGDGIWLVHKRQTAKSLKSEKRVKGIIPLIICSQKVNIEKESLASDVPFTARLSFSTILIYALIYGNIHNSF